ncbi:MAG: FecR domain-containing protein [Myxococcaceae bacterium]|nr:FecR domain-containing protein [Myxococcaceae bacterium]
MDELRAWTEATDEAGARAAKLVATAAAIPPAPVDLTAWDVVVARSAAPRHDGRLVFAFAASLAAGIALVVALSPKPTTPTAVDPPVLVASSSARWTQGADGVVSLAAGRLSVERASAAKLTLATPHATIEATRARFLAEVTAGGTTLVVEEGEVVLRAQGQTRTVKAGQTLVWPEAPNIPAPLEARPTAVAAVCEGVGARLDCLKLEAKGDGLAAQAALYELGVAERESGHVADALAAWTTSLSRFPDGVLHPEVRLALLVELTRQRRFAEALAVARGFETACAADPRVADVQALRRSLEGR